MPSNRHITRLHAALAGAGLMHQKYVMLGSYCQKGTDKPVISSKQLTNDQCDELISRLNAMQQGRYSDHPELKKGRSIIFQLATRLGKYDEEVEDSRIRMERFNRFMLDPRICGCMLYELDGDELTKLARKLRAMIRKEAEERLQAEIREQHAKWN